MSEPPVEFYILHVKGNMPERNELRGFVDTDWREARTSGLIRYAHECNHSAEGLRFGYPRHHASLYKVTAVELLATTDAPSPLPFDAKDAEIATYYLFPETVTNHAPE